MLIFYKIVFRFYTYVVNLIFLFHSRTFTTLKSLRKKFFNSKLIQILAVYLHVCTLEQYLFQAR